MKKIRSNMAVNIISGIVVVFIVVICISGYVGYQSFTQVLSDQYAETAYRTADTALGVIDGSKLDEYLATGGKGEEYETSRANMEELCNRQNAMFIYVIRPDADYSHITFVYNTVNRNSGFDAYKVGYVKDTTNDEYKEIYRRIYEEGLERATVVRDKGFIESGSHITELVPVKDGEKVTGILCVQRQMEALTSARQKYVNDVALALLGPILAVIVLYGVYLHRRLIKPVKTITREAERFARENSDPPQTLSSQITHQDEIGVLARSIDRMTAETLKYMENLTEATAVREKIATQLEVATAIQQNSLPQKFPAFPDRKEFDVYASMTPALEVGGDFYNFFLIDDNHLAMVIADVSDKGIGAALFMMVSNILIHNRALMGGKPSEVLEFVNNQLCAHNETSMFVTVWLGIMEISTGEIIASNAGHEYPIIKQGDGKFELYNDGKHGVMLGIMEGMKFTDYTFKLEKGGALYLYTDGVAEAEDTDHNQFGIDRTIEVLNKQPDATPKEIVNNIKNAIHDFVKDAPQFDDTTMLCVKRTGDLP
ncbi:MAG: SpoIIE family protein phosphatase [Clostridia bacterium]|nr:SpoIIE family protein phosphatase [Clostridia bacterium]